MILVILSLRSLLLLTVLEKELINTRYLPPGDLFTMSDMKIGTPKLPPLPPPPISSPSVNSHPIAPPQDMPPLPAVPNPNQQLASPSTISSGETLQHIEANPSAPQEIQENAQQLGGLKQSLALSIGVELAPPPPVVQQEHQAPPPPVVDNSPPPQYSSPELQTKLNESLKLNSSMTTFSETLQKLEQHAESMNKAQGQLKNVDGVFEKIMKDLDKREKAYNAPLYRLGSALGIKSRTEKLAALEQQRDTAVKSNEAMRRFNQSILTHDVKQIGKLNSQVGDLIDNAKQDGKNLVQSLQNDKAMMWSLSTQSKVQLRETLAQSMVNELPGGQDLLKLYQDLSTDYTQRKDQMTELKAQVKLYQNRVNNFNSELRELREKDPQAADQILYQFQMERIEFEKKLMPIAEKLCPEKAFGPDNLGNKRLNLDFIMNHVHFTDKPPKLFDVLTGEHQNYIDQMAKGIQSALPNKVVDDSSMMINGEKFSNKTFLAEAGFAKIYTYVSESDPTKKIVVKVPHKPAGMSEDDFQEKLQTESARELQNHYHAMGVNGDGHQNLVKLIGAVPTEQGPLIAMEFVDSGDCNQFINGINGKVTERLQQGEITPDEHRLLNKHVLFQMMQGLQYMQDRGMTHLDVKYDNFLIQSDGTVKVADLGLSKTEAEFHAKRQDRGDNPIYLPPEMMSNTLNLFADGREVSNKIDVWSVGVMAHEMLLQTRNRLDSNFMSKIESNNIKFGRDSSNKMFPDPQNPTEHFLNRMLHADPNQRASFKDLMKDPIFDELFAPGVPAGRGEYRQEVTDLVKRELAK